MGSLMFPVVLLVLLYTNHSQKSHLQMGMFPEAADYSFQNCRKEMLQMVTKSRGLLQTELNNNPDFKMMWKGNAACSKTIPGGTTEHMAALQSYAEASPKFHGRFKKLVQTISFQISFLPADRCHFFFPATLHYTAATEDTSLNYGCISEEIYLLISPTEVFTVTGIKTVSNSNDNFKEITVTHSHFQSSSNCSESKESSSSFLSSSLLNLMASVLMLYYTLTLKYTLYVCSQKCKVKVA
uniref:Mono(ADP-ribosyl)transferase n=1 Tax=Sinocyclocheilus grahami TaxID=75366 RepID=A0A672P8Q5_SINGR